MHAPSTPHHARRPSPDPLGPAVGADGGPGRLLDPGRLLLGLTIAGLGVLFLLDSADVLSADRAVERWWPAPIVAAGALALLERPASRFRATVLLAGGALLLLWTTDVLGEQAWTSVWPALVIAVGVAIAARWTGITVAPDARDEDVVRAMGIFGGPKVVSGSQAFRAASLTALFGGVTLDLRDAVPAADGATVNVTAVFGGVDILVPRGWRISVRATPIFGGFDDKTDHAVPPADDAPALHVDAVCVFGGVDVKHRA